MGIASSSGTGGKIGLKRLGDKARGLLTDINEEGEEEDELLGGEGGNVGASASVMDRRRRRRRHLRGGSRGSNSAGGELSLEELERQVEEIGLDKENLRVRRVSVWSCGPAGISLGGLSPRSTRKWGIQID